MQEPKNKQLTAAAHASAMSDYMQRGLQRGQDLGNHGPARFDSNGKLVKEILDSFHDHGYYVFKGLIKPEEIALLRNDMQQLIDQAPTERGATSDAQGRPAFGQQFKRNPYTFIKPLSDPWGGTRALNGRHPTQMSQPIPDADAPESVLYLMQGMCQIMASGLRLYGHPVLLAIAEAINGSDFVPYNDAIFIKPARLGGSVSWHQDGVTHWDSPNWDAGIHGFNFQVQLYDCTAANCLWVKPGTHKLGRIDIKQLVAENGGSDQLPGAVPLTCSAGDVTIVNRQVLHASFANTSPDPRISLTFGFHRRASILGAKGALSQTENEIYDEQRIFDRASIIALAINARAQHYQQETKFDYQPFSGIMDQHAFDEATIADVIRDYNLKDLSI